MESLINIQNELRVPKNQYNSFGKYKYRNTEDILESLKPLLLKYKCLLSITDDVVMLGDLIVNKSTCKISDGENEVTSQAFAGVDQNKKGMDIAQSFGSSSSYARKYALNALFLIDDTKDSDNTNIGNLNVDTSALIVEINKCKTDSELTELYKGNKEIVDSNPPLIKVFKTRKNKIKNPVQA